MGGFGAGVEGRGQQYNSGERERLQTQYEAFEAKRKRAISYDFRHAKFLLDQDDLQGIKALATERGEMIEKLGGDSSDTLNLASLAETALQGDEAALAHLSSQINVGFECTQGKYRLHFNTSLKTP